MKPYLSPPIWLMLGFLSGCMYCRPGIVIGIIWGVSFFAMLMWIMRDVEAMKPDSQGKVDGN